MEVGGISPGWIASGIVVLSALSLLIWQELNGRRPIGDVSRAEYSPEDGGDEIAEEGSDRGGGRRV